jgi:hypothetical protein
MFPFQRGLVLTYTPYTINDPLNDTLAKKLFGPRNGGNLQSAQVDELAYKLVTL